MKQQKSDSPDLLGEGKRFTLLLLAMLVLFLVLPLFSGYPEVFAIVNDLVFSIVMIAVVYALGKNRKHMIYALLLGLPAITTRWLYWLYSEQYLWMASYNLVLVYCCSAPSNC